MTQAKKGDRVRIFHELDRDGESVEGKVTAVLRDGFISAELVEQAHDLALLHGKPRILTVSPDLYEVIV